jgi:beta-lactamase superfamily II metal-dependent hydrolase
MTLRAQGAGELRIYFVDVEGGQATLMITPAGETVLIDAGYGPRGARNGIPPVAAARDAGRIMDAARDAGISRIDLLIVTHFHPDHVGGVPELAKLIPIGTFVDYGGPLGGDRMTANGFRNYEPVRTGGRHIVARAGERLPLEAIDATVVSAGGALISTPLAGAGTRNAACVDLEDHPEDGTENYRSVGVMFRFGAFSFLDLGDLSGNTLTALACPVDLLGPVSAYLIAHHGDYDSNVPALYASLQPRAVIMNNGVTRGASPVQFHSIRAERSIEDLWQLHYSHNEGVVNAQDPFIANVDDGTETSHWIKLVASADGTFRIENARNGFARTYGGSESRPYQESR